MKIGIDEVSSFSLNSIRKDFSGHFILICAIVLHILIMQHVMG